MANTKLPARLLDTSAVPTLNVTGTTTTNGNVIVVGSELRVQRPSGGTSYFGISMDSGEMVRLRNSWANKDIYFTREGNVGIGATPIALLDGNAAPGLTLTSNGPYILLKDANNADKVRYISNNTGQFQFGIVNDNGTTAKTEHMRIDSSGRVGIGTQNPSNQFVIKNSTNPDMEFGSESGGAFMQIYNRTNSTYGHLRFVTNGETMRLSNNGDVGIGEQSPSAKLHVKKTAATTQHYDAYATAIVEDTEGRLQIVATDGGSNASALILTNEEKHWGIVHHGPGENNTFGIGYYATSSSGADIADALSSPFTITTGGNVLIGKTTTNFQTAGVRIDPTNLQVTSTGIQGYFNRLTDGTTFEFYRGSSVVGSIGVATNGTYYATTSDRRLKENIIDAPSASDDIDSIQVRSYDWKSDGSHQKYGMVAQELQLVAPEAVTGVDYSTEMMSIDYSKLVPMLVKEIQSLRERVTQLEEEK